MSIKVPSIHEHLSFKKEEFYNNDMILKPMHLEQILLLRNKKRQETDLSRIYDINEEMKEIKIQLYKMQKLQKDYYLENFNILEKYYLNKQNIEQDNNHKIDINNILFKNKGKILDKNIFKQCHYKKYWLNNNVIINDNNNNNQICINCNNEIEDSICKICSVINKTLDITTAYESNENIKTNYIRINHMKKIMKQVQGIKTMNISLKIIDKIKERIDKERIDYNELTNNKIKSILKQLKLYKFMDQSTFFLIIFKKNQLYLKKI